MNHTPHLSAAILAAASRRRPAVQTDRLKRAVRLDPYWRRVFMVLLTLALLAFIVGLWLALGLSLN